MISQSVFLFDRPALSVFLLKDEEVLQIQKGIQRDRKALRISRWECLVLMYRVACDHCIMLHMKFV